MTREELQNKHGDAICEYCNKNIISEYNTGIGWLCEGQYCEEAQDDSVTDFERGQWSVIQNVIGYVKDYSLAAELCREAGIGYKKIKALQKDCGYSYKEEVNDFLKESRNCGTDLKLEE